MTDLECLRQILRNGQFSEVKRAQTLCHTEFCDNDLKVVVGRSAVFWFYDDGSIRDIEPVRYND